LDRAVGMDYPKEVRVELFRYPQMSRGIERDHLRCRPIDSRAATGRLSPFGAALRRSM